MIVRDEEDQLPRALASVAGAAEEIVLVDTGSRDATVEIAEQAGARIFHFPWVDDFGAARNAALEQAGGEWILWLDADEELLPESRKVLKSSLADETALAFHVLRRDLVDSRRLDRYTEMWQLRLFRNRPDLRFQGRCHPHFVPAEQEIAAAAGLEIRPSGIILRHYGYLAEFKQRKLERAGRLLELELQDRPGQLYYLIEYGRTLLQLRDSRAADFLARAAGQVLAHRREAVAPTPMVAALFEYLLQLPAEKLPAGWERPTEMSARPCLNRLILVSC
jgi:glycosyltransferase involved in cell wall biosynthesis